MERHESEDKYHYMEEEEGDEDEHEEEEAEEEEVDNEDEVESWVAIQKKRVEAKKRKRADTKKKNREIEAYLAQLDKDYGAGKLDGFSDIPLAEKKKAAEEEEVDSEMTKKKMDVGAGPSNVGPGNPGPVAPLAIGAPATPESSVYSSEGST
ncbi:FK506-binding protein 4-like [Panicum virgatum]|uniref:FK506-binding protein 4-like n=1 Tax=Panicum virgatum TaxID=38727 RepID=UPI0019D5A648|nr:FK506-binding protein 4-like [Panicum virgatum]